MIKTTDTTANAAYYLLEPTGVRKTAKTVSVSEVCNVDIDAEGYPVGIEVIYKTDKHKADITKEG